jgi:hypothetical protein
MGRCGGRGSSATRTLACWASALSGVGSASLLLAGASVGVAANENAHWFVGVFSL